MGKTVLIVFQTDDDQRKIKALLALHGVTWNEFGNVLLNNLDELEDMIEEYSKQRTKKAVM